MPGVFTIDFHDRTRASITYEAVAPRSGDAWTEMLYHVTFCVGRALVNLDREDQIEYARQFNDWLQDDGDDFPVHIGSPAVLIPAVRFVSSFDGDGPSYVRGAYGLGVNARGLDYYGPMAAGVLMRHIQDSWDRPDDLLRPTRTLCLRVLADGVDEAGHVQLVTECVTEAWEEFARGRDAALPEPEPEPEPLQEAVLPVSRSSRRGARWAVVAVGLALGLGAAGAWHLSQTPIPSSSSVSMDVTRVAPKAVMEARTVTEQSVTALDREIKKHDALVAERARLENEAREAEIARGHAAEEQAEAARQEADEQARQVERARKKDEEARKADEQRMAQQQEAARRPEAVASKALPLPLPSPLTPSSSDKTPDKAPDKTMVGKDGLLMLLVPAGEFLMGNQIDADTPLHRVFLNAFYMDRHEVTNGRYLKFVEATRHRAPQHVVDSYYDLWQGRTLLPGVADLPVVNVDWFDADGYCRWAGKRLPTEAEWEKAARGTDGRLYPWGNEAPSVTRLNFSRRWQGAHTLQSVGQYEAGTSPYGMQDMAGNVWEWVVDWYDAGSYAAGPSRNPRGPSSGSSKILRGGSWTNVADTVGATHRREEYPDMRNSDSGFRCALDAG